MKKIQKLDDITAADWEDIKWRREAGASLDQIADAIVSCAAVPRICAGIGGRNAGNFNATNDHGKA